MPTGSPTVDRTTLGATPVVRKALIAGEIDIYIEYTGNAGFFFNRASDPAWKDWRRGYELGAKLDYAANRIVWLTPANASNSWALAVREDVAAANRLHTMSDFARWVGSGGKVVLACSAEFANAGTLRSLEQTYGFKLRPDQLIVLAGGETSATIGAAAARTNGVNTAMVYGTDGGIVAANLRILQDDRHDQPVYAPVPTIRESALKAQPQIARLLQPLMASFDTRDPAATERACPGGRRVGRIRGRRLPASQRPGAVSAPRRAPIDRLGALLASFAAAALLFLPFVVSKANRIVPGTPRGLLDVLPPTTAVAGDCRRGRSRPWWRFAWPIPTRALPPRCSAWSPCASPWPPPARAHAGGQQGGARRSRLRILAAAVQPGSDGH